MVTILILWQHRVALKALFRQWKMSISIRYCACTFLCNKRLSCSYYFIATPKILQYRVALQRSSVAVWRVMLFFLFLRVLLFSSMSINSSTSVMSNVINLSAIFAGNFTTYNRKTTEKQRIKRKLPS